MRPAVSCPLRRKCVTSAGTFACCAPAASVTAAFSHASRVTCRALPSSSHARAVTKETSVSDSFTTRIWRKSAGRSSRANSATTYRGQMTVAVDNSAE